MIQPTLSILICTIAPEPGETCSPAKAHEMDIRARLHDRLLDGLFRQMRQDAIGEDLVQIKIDGDPTKHIGQKRRELVENACGKYVAFIDDDDRVSDDYLRRVLGAIKSDPDCASLRGEMIAMDHPGQPRRPFYHSLRYRAWFEEKEVYYRPPNHLNAVRRDLALQVPFLPLNFGEDKDFSYRLLPLLKTEASTGDDSPIYFYEYRRKKWRP